MASSPLYSHLYTNFPVSGINYNHLFNKGIYYLLITSTDSIYRITIHPNSIVNPNNLLMDKSCSVCNGVNDLNQAKICLITLDSASARNEIILEKGETDNMAGYYIVRENSIMNQFDSLTYINVDSSSAFLDNTANPASRIWRYRTYSEDVCGNSLISIGAGAGDVYKTIYLQQGMSTANSINLTWSGANPGYGFIPSWFIYRGNGNSSMLLIDSIPYSNTMYTDVNPQQGLNIYQVALRKTDPCIISRDSGEARSNFISTTFTSIDENSSSLTFSIFPNPANDRLNIRLPGTIKEADYTIMDAKGRIMQKGIIHTDKQVNTSSLSPGFYTLKIINEGRSGIRKLVIQ